MLKEALDYFNGDAGHRRLFSLFKKKYESLGRIGGTVKLDSFSDKELSSIALFFGMTVEDLKRKGKISLEQFDKQLERTKFQDIELKELLEAYFNRPLISKKESKQVKEQQQVKFLEQLMQNFPSLTFWLHYLLRKTPDTYWVYRLMDGNNESFWNAVHLLQQAFDQLPEKFERLPMFSQRITRNPHAFDRNMDLGKLWIHVLAVDQCDEGKASVPTDSEGINDLLLKYRILRDDITNYVTCANILAETKQGPHPMWEAAEKTASVMNIPLRELISIERAYLVDGNKKVFVVENSGVFSSILDQLPDVPLICSHGQFKLAALWLMDLLIREGYTLYYAGDFDPEGLSMASRLLERYPNRVKLWKMDLASYFKSESNVQLSEERLAKLESVTIPELTPMIEQIKKRKNAGYQEALVDEMVEELRRIIFL